MRFVLKNQCSSCLKCLRQDLHTDFFQHWLSNQNKRVFGCFFKTPHRGKHGSTRKAEAWQDHTSRQQARRSQSPKAQGRGETLLRMCQTAMFSGESSNMHLTLQDRPGAVPWPLAAWPQHLPQHGAPRAARSIATSTQHDVPPPRAARQGSSGPAGKQSCGSPLPAPQGAGGPSQHREHQGRRAEELCGREARVEQREAARKAFHLA